MFKENKDGFYYLSDKTQIEYSLLEGYTTNGSYSDIAFIFREPTEDDIYNGFTGEVIGFVYGGYSSNTKDFIEMTIKEYEKKLEKENK